MKSKDLMNNLSEFVSALFKLYKKTKVTSISIDEAFKIFQKVTHENYNRGSFNWMLDQLHRYPGEPVCIYNGYIDLSGFVDKHGIGWRFHMKEADEYPDDLPTEEESKTLRKNRLLDGEI